VIPMRGWLRGDWFDSTGATWVAPSPNLRSLEEATLYPGIALIETTGVSVGRGTDMPFQVIGSPYFTDKELAALQTALQLLDGQFAYAEPLRLALQQITWGRPSPLRSPEQRTVALAVTADAGGTDLSARLAKVETAIFRNKTIDFDYYTIERDETSKRRVDPYHLLYKGSQFYLLGHSHERDAIRVFRLSRIRGKVSYASKAEHDFHRPADFDPREYASRADWQLGDEAGTAEIHVNERIAWLIERHFGEYGELTETDDGVIFRTGYASARGVISWVLGLGQHATLLGPPELVEELQERLELID